MNARLEDLTPWERLHAWGLSGLVPSDALRAELTKAFGADVCNKARALPGLVPEAATGLLVARAALDGLAVPQWLVKRLYLSEWLYFKGAKDPATNEWPTLAQCLGLARDGDRLARVLGLTFGARRRGKTKSHLEGQRAAVEGEDTHEPIGEVALPSLEPAAAEQRRIARLALQRGVFGDDRRPTPADKSLRDLQASMWLPPGRWEARKVSKGYVIWYLTRRDGKAVCRAESTLWMDKRFERIAQLLLRPEAVIQAPDVRLRRFAYALAPRLADGRWWLRPALIAYRWPAAGRPWIEAKLHGHLPPGRRLLPGVPAEHDKSAWRGLEGRFKSVKATKTGLMKATTIRDLAMRKTSRAVLEPLTPLETQLTEMLRNALGKTRS